MISNFRRIRGPFCSIAARTFLGLSLLTGSIATVLGQENTGLITGIVSDASGAGVPGATVSAVGSVLPKGLEVATDAQGK